MALENAWNQAELHNDPAALKLLLTEDFIITEPDGELMTKGQLMATTADGSYHYDVLVSEGYRVRVYGTLAVVTGTYHEKGSASILTGVAASPIPGSSSEAGGSVRPVTIAWQ